MAWGQPKRNGRCMNGHRGQCSCQRRQNEEVSNNSSDAPRTCTTVCRTGKGACGKTMRGGKCPCGWCD